MTDQTTIKRNFIKTITRTIADFNLLDQKDSVLTAVSGGSDSVCLMLSLLALKEKYKITIGIAHLNHLLRGEESFRDETFVKTLAKKFGLVFHCEKIDVKAHAKKHGLSIEEAGREVRYNFFNQIAKTHGYKKIATGHNKNDNAELVLMNLLRGSGTKGLSGIPPKRDDRFIRPLIQVPKTQILDFLTVQNQTFVSDSSNMDMTYLRNKIRHNLIPHIQSEYNPEITNTLDRLSSILRQEEDFWNTKTQKAFYGCLIKTQPHCLTFSKSLMTSLHPALLKRVLRKAIQTVKTDLKRISLAHITDIIDFSFNTSPGISLDLPGQIRVYKSKDIIMIKKETQPLREIGKKDKQTRQMSLKKQDKKS
ncbi:tRNA lysidine(34) synthetase TilS [Desulfobacula sp.]